MTATAFDSPGKVRRVLDDRLFRVRPAIYWADFGTSISIAWAAFWMAAARSYSPWTAFWLIISSLAFYRGLFFIHELSHIRGEKMRSFRWAWNALCGMVFFLPDITYAIHSAHHLTATYSTRDDPEYLPLRYQKPLQIAAPFILFPFVPWLLMTRFLLAAPVSWIIRGRFRDWLLRSATSLKMNPRFEWNNVTAADRRTVAIEEAGCLFWWTLFLALTLVTRTPRILVIWYLVTYLLLTLNHLRAIVAHGYINRSGERVTYEEQLLDSISITGFSPLASLLAPVGLRYHSLHHMFPTLPYHAMPAAHRQLVEALPPDHLYFRTFVPGLTSAFSQFWRAVRANDVAAG
jgi:fatty acid desaturase